jgi:outer membrane lipoprotein-sorting protein
MKKAILSYFILAGFILISAGAANAQSILGDILRRMDEHNKSLQTLKASLKMSKYNAQIDEYDVYSGTVQYIPSQDRNRIRVRIDWEKPDVEQLSIAGGEYVLFKPRLNQAIVGKVDSAKNAARSGNALDFLSMNRKQLRDNYEVAYLGEETVNSNVRTWHLQLTPKTAKSYKVAELWVDKDGMPVQAKITENNKDTTTILLSDIQKNVSLKAQDFAIKLPKDVKKIPG